MKTEGLTLIEAERARVAGVCKYYRREVWRKIYKYNGECFFNNGVVDPPLRLSKHDILATDYQLIDPVLPTKEVPVEGYAIIDPAGNKYWGRCGRYGRVPSGEPYGQAHWVDVVPVEEPVRKGWVLFNIITTFFLIVNVVLGIFVIPDWVEEWHMSYYQRHNYPIVVYKDTVKLAFRHYT